jgi:hypothetical protein
MSVASLGSSGAWGWVAILVAAVSIAALFAACGRLGYFQASVPESGQAAPVVSLEHRRMARAACETDEPERLRIRAR